MTPFGRLPPNLRTPPSHTGQFYDIPLDQGPQTPIAPPTSSPMMPEASSNLSMSSGFQNTRPQTPARPVPPGQLRPNQMPPPGQLPPSGPSRYAAQQPPFGGFPPNSRAPPGPTGQFQDVPLGQGPQKPFAPSTSSPMPGASPNMSMSSGLQNTRPQTPAKRLPKQMLPFDSPKFNSHLENQPPSSGLPPSGNVPKLVGPLNGPGQFQNDPQGQVMNGAGFRGSAPSIGLPKATAGPNRVSQEESFRAHLSNQPTMPSNQQENHQPPLVQQPQSQSSHHHSPAASFSSMPQSQVLTMEKNANQPPRVSQPLTMSNQPPTSVNSPSGRGPFQPQFRRPAMSNQPPLLGNQPQGAANQSNSFNQRSMSGQAPPQPSLSMGSGPEGALSPQLRPLCQSPMPGQQRVSKQFNHGPGSFPPPGGVPGGMPEVPQHFDQSAQSPMFNSPNQLANQMQGMNLTGPRQYPVSQDGNVMNVGGPPPPVNQQPQQTPLQPQYMQQRTRSPVGYPPMPGPGAAASAAGVYPSSVYQQPQQTKGLDPDEMPSPIEVTQENQANRSGVFYTNQKGLVPPLVATNFVVEDQGNSSPRFIRSTMYSVPVSKDMMKETALPFSLVISPMARTAEGEFPPPIVNLGDLGPVRCSRCKAYMCPFMQFIDAGTRFQCFFCKATTDVPMEYFQHLDHTGQRLDLFERPELLLGTYEFVATSDYCRDNVLPKPPAMIFIIDVSYNSIKSGLVNLLCSQMKEIIRNLPVDQDEEKSNMRVGFITYNSSVHFYNIKGNLVKPQMLVVSDMEDMFMPLLDGFLCTPEESGPIIDSLMEQIPEMFGQTRETEIVLLPAILAGLEALKATKCTGKLLVFTSTLPTAEAPGKLKNRDDRKLLSTDKEKTVLTPQTEAYRQLGQDCVGAGCAVDLFVFNNAYIDVATISQVSRLTGGEVYKYTYFQADLDGDRLIADIITNVSRPIAFDSLLRVRTSTGVRPTDFYGHFFMSNTTDMELAAVDCDKAMGVGIKHDDKLDENEGVYIQAALLYTSCSGQRRIRIFNLSLKTCSQMVDLYRSCDCDAIINYIAKKATYMLYANNPKAVKDGLVTRAAQILAAYRKNCVRPGNAGQLILPDSMKLLSLYINCLMKSDALSGSDMSIDDRSYVMQKVMFMDISTSVKYLYPRLMPLHEIDLDSKQLKMPSAIRCTVHKMSEQGVYILENGIHMFLWIGLGASSEFIQKVFGVPSAIQVDVNRTHLPELDNDMSRTVRALIDEIRLQSHRCMRLTLVRQREKLEPVFKHFLAEDGSPSYSDFLIRMHKEIGSLLS